ncbi:MAG: 1,4-dihydroxy-2-naphthoate polyprenyltransferase [Candidatus Pelagadaptatus aseana]|uniref:1,4-dihydroxy-2-naphthoate octaprenyltransferase n=1 Tax=Candidatus Pelagadaptatus aseana TaxID=3120508 RepID=UPI0039B291A1
MKHWILATRPQTLLISVVPIVLSQTLALVALQDTDSTAQLASASAVSGPQNFSWGVAWLCLGCAVALQVAVNLANDYFDLLSGVDGESRIGPDRATQSGWMTPQQMRWGFIVALAVGVMLGLWLLSLTSWQLLLPGLFCVLAVVTYTSGPFPLAYNALGELAVFIVFGPIAVMGSYFAQTASWWSPALAYGVLFSGLIAAAIMLTNNIRDLDSDLSAGKHTLVYYLGVPASRMLYLGMIGIASGALVAMVGAVTAPVLVWLALPLALWLGQAFMTREGPTLNRQLVQTAQFMLVAALLAVIDLLV